MPLQSLPYSIESTWTNPDQINAANATNVSDIDKILAKLDSQISQGLEMYSSGATAADIQDSIAKAKGYAEQTANADLSSYDPFIKGGQLAQERLNQLQGLGDNPLTAAQVQELYLSSPAVQAQLEQGNKAIQANYAAKGLVGSGAMAKALQTYGQNTAAGTLSSAQDKLLESAKAGASAASNYANSLINKYSNAGQIVNNTANLVSAGTSNANSASSFLSNIATKQADVASQAASNRQSALVNAAQKTKQTYQYGYKNSMFGTMNSNLSI